MPNDNWQTPRPLFDHYDRLFGFTLDAAASVSNHLTDYYCVSPDDWDFIQAEGTIYDGIVGYNGLAYDWTGERVWVNPPYSDPGPWARKAAVSDALTVALLPVDPSTQWWQHYVLGQSTRQGKDCRWAYLDPVRAKSIEYLPRRVRFVDPETGKPAAGARFANAVVTWWGGYGR